MEVTYTLTQRDYIQALRASIKSGRKLFSLPNVLLWALVLTLALDYLARVLDLGGEMAKLGWTQWMPWTAVPVFAMGLGLLAALAGLFAFLRSPGFQARRRFSAMQARRAFAPGFFGPQRLVLEERVLALSFGAERRELRYGGLSLRQAGGYVLLYSGKELVTAVPPAAFPDVTARLALAGALEAAIATDQAVDPTTDPLWDETRAQAQRVLTFTWTEEDLAAALCREARGLFFTRWYWVPTGLWIAGLSALLLIAGGYAMAAAMPLAGGLGLGAMLALVGLTLLYALFSPLLPGYQRRMVKSVAPQAGPQLVCCTDRGVQIHRRRTDASIPWQDVQEVRQERGAVYLLLRGRRLLPLPLEGEEAAQFAAYVETKL